MTASTERRVSPLAAWTTRFAEASANPARFAIRELPFLAQIGIRGDAQAPGISLPRVANTWTNGGDCQVLWLGPDEWLVIAEDTQREKLLQLPHAVDLSASRAVLELSGADARGILAKGCTLDLRAGSFRPPQCAQTLLARTQMLLQAMGDQTEERPAFRIFVRASFSPYLAEWLLDAAAETRASSGVDAGRIADRLAYTVHSPAQDA